MYQTRHEQLGSTLAENDPLEPSSQTTIITCHYSSPTDDSSLVAVTAAAAAAADDDDDAGNRLRVEGGKPNSMTYSSPGEAIVYREMAELRRREAELRRRWQEMGFELSPVDDNWITDDIDGAIESHIRPTPSSESNGKIGKSPTGTFASKAQLNNQTSGLSSAVVSDRPTNNRGIIAVIDIQNNVIGNGNELINGKLRRGSIGGPIEVESRVDAVEDGVRRSTFDMRCLFESTSNQQLIKDGRTQSGVSTEDGFDVDTFQRSSSPSARVLTGQLKRGKTRSRPSRDDAERRIEVEVAEVRKREAELRLCCSQFEYYVYLILLTLITYLIHTIPHGKDNFC